jgi:hypothetical protein
MLSVGASAVAFARPHACRVGIPCVTDCVIAELEKLGQRYRLALRCVRIYAPPLSNRAHLISFSAWPVIPALNVFTAHTRGHTPMIA